MYKGILHTHYFVVTLFLLIYVIKTILLLSNKSELLAAFTKKVKIPEMIVSFLFLATGVYLMTLLPFGGKFDYLFWIKIVLVLSSIPLAVVGFKKQNKLLASLSLLMIVASFGLAEVYSKKKGVAEEGITDASVTDGKTLYETNCKLCHGDDGKLGMAGARDISATGLDAAAIKEVILKGQKTMAPVNVSDEQAAAIAEYVSANLKGR